MQWVKRSGVSVTVETNLIIADCVVTSFKPTLKKDKPNTYTQAQVLSLSKGTITTPASNEVLQTAKSRVAERERDNRG